MNILAAQPRQLTNRSAMDEYFADVDRLRFDIPAILCRGHSIEEVVGPLSGIYGRFSEIARSKGLPSALAINVYHGRPEILPTSELQYHRDNRPAEVDRGFFASFASVAWREHLKRIISVFVQDYGYSLVLIGEPIYGVDIPGSCDRVHEEFVRACPDLVFPERREETASYLSLQKVKTEVLLDFCDELSSHAKSVGAEKVAVMPRPFTASLADACGALEIPRCCDNGRLIALPSVDYAVVRITADTSVSPEIPEDAAALTAYTEILSNAASKGVIAVAAAPSPAGWATAVDSMTKSRRKATIAGIGAAPCGMMFLWKCGDAELDTEYARVVSIAKETLPRMSGILAPGAMVYSQCSTWHDEETASDAWAHYWSLAHQLIQDCGLPVPTVNSSVIDSLSTYSPNIRALLLEEHSPLTPAQVESVLHWWRDAPGRNIVVIGNGKGLSADPLEPGEQNLEKAFPGLLESIGLKLLDPGSIARDPESKLRLKAVGCVKPKLPPDGTEVEVEAIANVEKIFGSGCRVLYSDEEGHPVITSRQEGDRAAYFFGLGIYDATAPIVAQLREHMVVTGDFIRPPIRRISGHVRWNFTQDGYTVVTNSADEPAYATFTRKPFAYWDVIRQELIKDKSVELKLDAGEIRVLRWVPKTAKLIDVVRGLYVHAIKAGAGRAEIDIDVAPETAFIVRTPPNKVLVDGVETRAYSVECYSSFTKVTLDELNSGRHVVSMSW